MLAELEDRVEQILAALEQLREVVDDGKQTRQILDSVFRTVHSLKASAAANNLDDPARIAHQFENLLHSLRTGKATLNARVLRAFDETAEALLNSLHESPDQADLTQLFNQLQQLSEAGGRGPGMEVEIVLSALPTEVWQSLSDSEKHRLKESVGEGARLYLVTASFDVTDFDVQFQGLKDKLGTSGEIISTAPGVDQDRPGKIAFRVLYSRDTDLNQINEEISGIPGVEVKEVANTSSDSQLPSKRSSRKTSPDAKLIRINLADLDHVISATHKLLRQTSMPLTATTATQDPRELRASVATLRKSFMDLAADLINLRMISIERTLQRAARAGRAVAIATGKEIDCVVSGSDLLLDKSLCDAITDPLIHLVRNAVDHGIEDPEERARLGKHRRGAIRIEAATQQGQTRVTVTDDGRGIDPVLVTKAAVRLGVVEQGSVVGVDQSLRLLFRPGFSTATEVSSVSGRGVGLDVVETAVEEVGGAVRISSEPGKGSAFEIRLPVTFALLDVAPVEASGQRYLIDQSHIVATMAADKVNLVLGASGAVIQLQDEKVPLFSLSELLRHESVPLERLKQNHILLCRFTSVEGSTIQLALLVDAVAETQQVLVRNLGSRGGRWFGVAGASELPDGSVVLLLDLPRLMLTANKSRQRE